MPSHKVTWKQGNETFDTLEDILPAEGENLRILFVGRVPSPESVRFGHYWQGHHGQLFWEKLREYNILNTPKGIINGIGEDDHLLHCGYGMIDIANKPRYTGEKVSSAEYREGHARLLSVVSRHNPEVIVFIYKTIIPEILGVIADYGFNDNLKGLFGDSRIFVFPMPGTPCNREVIKSSMGELKDYLGL